MKMAPAMNMIDFFNPYSVKNRQLGSTYKQCPILNQVSLFVFMSSETACTLPYREIGD
jgi:hypothetical protein